MNNSQTVGGQAVLEGVMMRYRDRMAIACRRADDTISIHQETLKPLSKKFVPLGWPIIRGAVAFFEALVLGVRALNISAAEALAEEEEELTGWHSFLMVFLGLGLGVSLFFILPTYLVRFLPEWRPVTLNLIEGIIRLVIFLAYIFLITRWGDVQRFFQYHGSEHKVIYGYENSETQDLDQIIKYSTKHPRCGTSFILTVMVVSIILFSFFGWPDLLLRIGLRLILLPVVAGLSYEAIRYSAKSKSPLVCIITAPGLWLQRLTTREPDKNQLEVALCALKAVLEPFGQQEEAATEGKDEVNADTR
ncbi:MAG: DUF1385 domain-containing protein [Bacillota bacterium]